MRLFGKNPVLERLRTNPQSVRRIHVQMGSSEFTAIRRKASKRKIPVVSMPRTKMAKLGRALNMQGVFCVVDDFEYEDYNELLEESVKKGRTLIFLDGVTDPQNLGAVIRSLACLGKFAVILPTHKSVSITESVLRVASGGENYVPIAQVSNINKALRKAKDAGFSIVGTVVNEGEDVRKVNWPDHIGVVVGSEQKGIRDVIKQNLDVSITIPMEQETLSLNVAHATSIICYEIIRQKS